MEMLQSLYSRLKSEFFLIAGPCVVESKEICFQVAKELKEIESLFSIPVIFKSSYRKANRTSSTSFSGIGDKDALKILEWVKNDFDLPVLTDIHSPEEASTAAEVADIIQVPAFLCRQTEILYAASLTGNIVNVKKGQFLSPESMEFVIKKIKEKGNHKVLLTERGTSFGYTDLIVDIRSIPLMQSFEVPVVLDCTHSLQKPNQPAGITGGSPRFIPHIAFAGTAAGANGLFIETHPEPAKALSDGANMLPLDELRRLIHQVLRIYHSLDKK